MRSVVMRGVGRYLPRTTVESTALESRLGLATGWIEAHTGIRTRHVADPDEGTVMMACAAITAAAAHAQLDPTQLDGVIYTGVSREQLIPCTAVLIAGRLGINGAACLDIDATCLSFLAGLDVAAWWIAQGRCQRIVVVAAEIASSGLDWSEPASAVLMGDCAAAVIVEPGKIPGSGFQPLRLRTYPKGSTLAHHQGFGTRAIRADPQQTIDRHRFHMAGPELFRFAARPMAALVQEYLADLEWTPASVAALLPHQASQHAYRAIAKLCGFAPHQVRENINAVGNCLAASLPLLLAEEELAGRLQPGQRILLAGTAAGVSVAAMGLIR